jgi:hypothetical protein
MKKWSSIRLVYLLMSAVLLSGFFLQNWHIVIFVVIMLNVGVWTRFCPSKWIFEKLGFKKSEL